MKYSITKNILIIFWKQVTSLSQVYPSDRLVTDIINNQINTNKFIIIIVVNNMKYTVSPTEDII